MFCFLMILRIIRIAQLYLVKVPLNSSCEEICKGKIKNEEVKLFPPIYLETKKEINLGVSLIFSKGFKISLLRFSKFWKKNYFKPPTYP